MIFEVSRLLARLRLAEGDLPLSLLFIPIASSHFGVEIHVFAKTESLADFVQIFPDIRAVREEAWPVRILNIY